MLRYLMGKLGAFEFNRAAARAGDPADTETNRPAESEILKKQKFGASLSENRKLLENTLGNSTDLVWREFTFGKNGQCRALLVFVDGLVNQEVLNDNVMGVFSYQRGFSQLVGYDLSETGDGGIEQIKTALLAVADVKDAPDLGTAVAGCLSGETIFIVDGCPTSLLINTRGWDKRSVSEPETESVIRGPREGFNENLRTNTSLIRRKIKSPGLTMESLKLGRRTRTDICLVYIKGVCDPGLLGRLRKRLRRIDTDAVLESGYIEQYIEDAPFSLFPTVGYSEKPDVVAAKLLEGRAALIIDGTPFVLTVPFLFNESFQTSEDYYIRPYFATFSRILRYAAYFISILGPALYVALTTFHQELLPTSLLFTMTAARDGVPFPAALEAALMLGTFEILREGGLRLPKPVGQAISIVGALVMGESAVSAGLVSAPMVVVIAMTAVAGFVVPTQTNSGSLLRIIFLGLSAALGGYGILLGLLGMFIHLSGLTSFGVDYLSPAAPFHLQDAKDLMVRAPLWLMLSRPVGMARKNTRRQKFFVPSPGGADKAGGSDGAGGEDEPGSGPAPS